jgi:hypothetical protein
MSRTVVAFPNPGEPRPATQDEAFLLFNQSRQAMFAAWRTWVRMHPSREFIAEEIDATTNCLIGIDAVENRDA